MSTHRKKRTASCSGRVPVTTQNQDIDLLRIFKYKSHATNRLLAVIEPKETAWRFTRDRQLLILYFILPSCFASCGINKTSWLGQPFRKPKLPALHSLITYLNFRPSRWDRSSCPIIAAQCLRCLWVHTYVDCGYSKTHHEKLPNLLEAYSSFNRCYVWSNHVHKTWYNIKIPSPPPPTHTHAHARMHTHTHTHTHKHMCMWTHITIQLVHFLLLTGFCSFNQRPYIRRQLGCCIYKQWYGIWGEWDTNTKKKKQNKNEEVLSQKTCYKAQTWKVFAYERPN